MNAHADMNRKDLTKYLGLIRTGENSSISQSTLWRWCDLAGIESRKRVFEPCEVGSLAAIAQLYAEGKTTEEILSLANHSREVMNSHE